MILLVPTSPEVPPNHLPKFWPGLVLVLILAISYSFIEPSVKQDKEYVDGLQQMIQTGAIVFDEQRQDYLKSRPLLKISPAHADWDLKRLFYANFIHGNKMHLALNLIAAYAGARICATFLSFFWISVIFLVGGTLGLFVSVNLPTEFSPFIPHVGASAGIFALMGTYYIFNFRYRTRYFFWFPAKHGNLALPTSWFFFFDVVLLEVVLSVGQLFPTRLDAIDHISHVAGFTFGVAFALFLRVVQGWPSFIHTKGELVFWKSLKLPEVRHPIFTPLETWLKCLEINPYNDRFKNMLFRLLIAHSDKVTDNHVEQAFRFVRPAFCRRSPQIVADLIKGLLIHHRQIPAMWLKNTPYDVIIRLAKHMVVQPDDQALLFQFISAYRAALPDHAGFHHKLELLLNRLGGGTTPQPAPTVAHGSGGRFGNVPSDNNPPINRPGSRK